MDAYYKIFIFYYCLMQIVEKPDAKAVRTSAVFFSRLQNEVNSHIKMKAADSSLVRQKNIRSVKRLKL
jgi:hypothetical protein